MRRVMVLIAALAACRAQRTAEQPRHYGLGRAATEQDIAARDVDVGPDGAGLPPGSGTAAQGEVLFTQKCASCHGPHGEGVAPTNLRLVGRDSRAENFRFASDPSLPRSIGNYWPYATTIFDYVRRAMPVNAPGSLSNDEVYALTAYILSLNKIIGANDTMNAQTLPKVRMPNRDGFIIRFPDKTP